MAQESPTEPVPAATVVVLRDGDSGLEVLLLQRSSRPGKPPGPWVFPGGKLEARDEEGAEADIAAALLRAACRETREEAGLELDGAMLIDLARWITPEVAPRRFDTWFYATRVAADAQVRVDGIEIAAHRWLSPERALSDYDAAELRLAPPTYVTIYGLAGFASCADALAECARTESLIFRPKICPSEEGAWMLYPGDAGYDDANPQREGRRHRLWSDASGYRYERSDG